eukprot:m.210992 g.210992  ORF g.210992 m.210992 type:complete len:430 (-) comp33098_c0_seq1:127-1416(-)
MSLVMNGVFDDDLKITITPKSGGPGSFPVACTSNEVHETDDDVDGAVVNAGVEDRHNVNADQDALTIVTSRNWNDKYKASLLMAWCAFAFSLASCFTVILRQSMSLWTVMFFRLSIAWILTLGTLIYKSETPFDRSFFNSSILIRTALNIVCVILEIFTLSRLRLTQATVMMYTHPLFAVVLGAIFLGEAFGLKETGLLLLALSGVVINTQPWLDTETTSTSNKNTSNTNTSEVLAQVPSSSVLDHPYAITSAFAFAIMVAVLFVWIRLKLKDVSALLVVHHYLLIGSVFALVMALATDPNAVASVAHAFTSVHTAPVALLCGGLVFSGEVTGNLAVQQGNIGPVVAVRNLDIVLVFIWQPLLLDQPVTVVGGVGALIILIATTWLVVVAAKEDAHRKGIEGSTNEGIELQVLLMDKPERNHEEVQKHA